MKTKAFFLFAIALLLTLNSHGQQNEKRFGVEVNGGLSFATTELNGSDLNLGAGFETVLQYRFMPNTSVYGGWGWNHFNADQSFAGADMDFEETGYLLGLQYKRQIGNSPVSWFVRGGGLLNHIETENNDGDVVSDSGHDFGWQVAGGFEFNLGKNWSLAPGIKYNSLSTETGFNNANYKLDYRYLSVRAGIVKRF